jgi:flagellar protein FlaG
MKMEEAMKVDSAAVAGSIAPKVNTSAEDIDRERKNKDLSNQVEPTNSNKVQPEEILDQIKALTEDGAYSVRFEKDNEHNKMVVRLVDVDSGETIRQIPPEELIDLTEALQELRGNVVDITG